MQDAHDQAARARGEPVLTLMLGAMLVILWLVLWIDGVEGRLEELEEEREEDDSKPEPD